MDPKLLEDWLRLAADAMKGATEARRALEAFGQAPLSPEALARWAALWMPGRSGETQSLSELQGVVEDWWKAIGVVPRHRYLELLEKYEELRTRLEEAESKVRDLRELLAKKGWEQETRGALEKWEETTHKILEAQAEWAKAWTEGVLPKTAETDEKD